MTGSASEWTKVLMHPRGLVGYALFLLFALLARVKRRDERRWILPAALLAAIGALLGGLGLAYWEVNSRQVSQTVPVPVSTPSALQQQNDHPQQSSTGSNSHNVQGVQGDVNITYGAGSPSEVQNRQQRKRQAQTKRQEKQAQ